MRAARVRQTLLFAPAFLYLFTGAGGARAQGRDSINPNEPANGAQHPDLTKPSSAGLSSGVSSTVSVHQLSVPANARKALEKGRRLLLDEHRAEDSLAAFRKAVQIAPAYWEGHFLLGIAYMGLGKWSDAELSLVRAISFNDGLGPAYLALGSALLEEGKYSEAEQRLLRGLELSPEAPHGHYDLSRTYYALSRFEEAKLHALKAIDLENPKADAHFLLGNILLRLDDGPGALAQLQECVRLAPDSPFAAQARDQISGLQSRKISAR